MEQKIKSTIKSEIEKHSRKMDEQTIDMITEAIFKQLLEYMEIEVLEKMMEHLQGEFIRMIDLLIPVVDEYENQIDAVLDSHIGKFIK